MGVLGELSGSPKICDAGGLWIRLCRD